VARHVHHFDRIVQHLGAALEEPVDRAVHHLSLPGTGCDDMMTVSPRCT
jgi:hypothetical protein